MEHSSRPASHQSLHANPSILGIAASPSQGPTTLDKIQALLYGLQEQVLQIKAKLEKEDKEFKELQGMVKEISQIITTTPTP
ncbi:unnamed protein product [Rhizoctonia solani]|uniref:Uncharacterized protein n=1 Tax=Rhizoctonia solani TaxID=456999 RepID=A0A8H2WIN4_9AGAM|nr:unnamed protein product [Rhizoctonia solani]